MEQLQRALKALEDPGIRRKFQEELEHEGLEERRIRLRQNRVPKKRRSKLGRYLKVRC